ncbi:MAG: diphthine synthase [Candidatus Micrarchaeaceae archaeon]
MLFLVGLGLCAEDIPNGANAVLERCDLYLDSFTSMVGEDTLEYVKRVANGKPVKELSRSDMEENMDNLLDKASESDVAVLAGGDPLMATTHKILYSAARRRAIGVKVVHANSIITTAMGESGLDFYRFGAPCTIPKWSEHYKPTSFYEKIRSNTAINEHTMLLLDYDQKSKSTISVSEAVERLLDAEKRYCSGIISGSTAIMVLHNMGRKGENITLTTVEKAKELDYDGLNILILPARLSEIEDESVKAVASVT